jgi:hypothetical protein
MESVFDKFSFGEYNNPRSSRGRRSSGVGRQSGANLQKVKSHTIAITICSNANPACTRKILVCFSTLRFSESRPVLASLSVSSSSEENEHFSVEGHILTRIKNEMAVLNPIANIWYIEI